MREHGNSLVLQSTAMAGLARLDTYLALRKPVMVGVHHSYASGYNPDAPNHGTTDQFVIIVGTGIDAQGRKYYRFFDVGTVDAKRKNGVDERNRLYYDARTGMCSGKSIVNNLTYTISQLRFKPGTF